MTKAREIIQSGVLGRLVGVSGPALFYKPDDYFDVGGGWRREPGGGPILPNLTHEVNNLMGCDSAADTVGAASTVGATALPCHHQLAFCPEPLEVAGQHVFDMGERVGVLGGGFEHQLVVLRPDSPGTVGEHQPSAMPLALNRLDGVLAAEMGKELLRVAFGRVSGHHCG